MDLTYELLRRGREAAADFEYFCRFVLNIKKADHQEEWFKLAQDIGDNPDGKKVIIIAPPGSGKTTLVGVGLVAWMIGRYPERHYGLFVYADKPAWERSLAVRKLIEFDKPYHFAFPHIKPDFTAWDKSTFRIQRQNMADPHPTLRAGGTGSSVVSYRINGLIIDDPMSQRTAATSELREKTFKNYEEAIETRLTTDAWQFWIGTRWSDDDFIGRMLERKDHGGFEVTHVKAILDNGTSYWPSEYPIDKLNELKEAKPATFHIQYQGDTTGGETQIIKQLTVYEDKLYEEKRDDAERVIVYPDDYEDEEEIGRFVEVDKYNKDLLIGIGIDTALKKGQENDYTVGYIGGLDKNGRVWILDRFKGRFGTPELKNKIKLLYKRWRPMNIWVEDSAQGTPAVETVRAALPYIPIMTVPVSAGGSTNRVNALQSHMHPGYVVFPRFVFWLPDCRYYLTHFPYTDHDDDVDGLFVLVDNLLQAIHPSRYEDERISARIQYV